MADNVDGAFMPCSNNPDRLPKDEAGPNPGESDPAGPGESGELEPTGLESPAEAVQEIDEMEPSGWEEEPPTRQVVRSAAAHAPRPEATETLQEEIPFEVDDSRLGWALSPYSLGPAAALVAILLIGAYFRLVGLNWDSLTHIHPDERFITMVEGSLAWPKSLAEYFNTAQSPLNPYNRGYNSFVYGTFPLFLAKFLGNVLDMGGYDQIHLVGRALSALFDLGSVALIFFIGRRLYGVRAGLLASLLTAATVTDIQQAHFFTFDTFVVFFSLASFFFAVRLWQDCHRYDYLLLGASLGLAMACKINSAIFAVVVGLVALKQMHDVTLREEYTDRVAEWMRIAAWFAVSALTALVVFRIAEPYAFSGPGFFDFGLSKKFLDDMGYVQKLVSGEIDQPPSVQWAGTTPYLFPLRTLVIYGMGIPLGIIGWAGLLFAAYRLVAKRDSRHLLVVAWVAFFFWYQGGQLAKTMRSFMPIVPLLALLGAHLMLQIVDAARGMARTPGGVGLGGFRRYATYAGPALIVLVTGATLLYAVAFSSIYTRPLSRITASEWIFDNVPKGAVIKNEHWDDPLPLRWKGRDAGWYNGGDLLPLYDEDTPEKLNKLAGQLDVAEWIFISSDRLYGSIPRMPMKYPMTSEYYRLLFSGELGFKLEQTFTSYPSLLGLQFNDDGSEEIFRNYDHPKVLIFQKTPEYSSAKVRALLGAVPLDKVLRIKTNEANYNGLLLSDTQREADEGGGSWSALYDRLGVSNRLPTLTWWLVLELLGLLALPLSWRLFRRFRDRGYGLAKMMGLLMVAYVGWAIPSLHLLPFGPPSILVGVALLSLSAVAILRGNWAQFHEFWITHKRVMLVHELVFLGFFIVFWLIRVRNPDLWNLNYGGEKPMDFAYLNAVAKSTYFPPYDPWMAGGYINYYYFGFVIVATLIRLTGIVPAVAYNLAIPTLFALTAAGLFTFGFNYALVAQRQVARLLPTRSVLAGLATASFVLVIGSLDGALQILEGLSKAGALQLKSTIPLMEGTLKALSGLWAVVAGGKAMPAFDFWRSTRVIGPESPGPISEFPWFTFLYGDLHAHMTAMPLATLALGLVLAIVWQGRKPDGEADALGDAERPRRGDAESEVLPLATVTLHLPTGEGETEAPNPEPRTPGRWPLNTPGWLGALVSERALAIYAGGLVVGALQATNTWDYPTYLGLLSVAYLVSSCVRDRGLTIRGLTDAGLSAAATYGVAALLFLPYTRAYELFYTGIDPAPAKTAIPHYLTIWGFFLFCNVSVLLVSVAGNRWHRFWLRGLWDQLTCSTRADRRRELMWLLVHPTPWLKLLPYAAVVLIAAALGAFVLKLYLVALLVVVGLLALLALFERDAPPEKQLLALFVGLGLALTLGVEFITIKGDIGRMNTVFKFYLQAWFLFGVASALGVSGLLWGWNRARSGHRSGVSGLWATALAILLAAVLIYPIEATPAKVEKRFQPLPDTLDGMAYMKVATFKEQNNTDIVGARDYTAITWIQDHVAGSPVVLEAQIPEYRWGSRVSIYTGLPTVLGWTWHQRQQRSGYGYMIDDRLRDIPLMFNTQDPAQAETLLRKYNVTLVYVGDLERAYYAAAGLAKFDKMVDQGTLSVAYRADGVTIYEVMRGGRPSVVLSDGGRRG